MPNKSYKILLAVVAVATTAFYFFVNPAKVSFTPSCLLHKSTGLYCFGCGGQRAFHAILHGRFTEAIQDNVLIFLILPILTLYFFAEIFNKRTIILSLKRPVYFWIFIILLFSFMVLRNLPYYPFNSFIPHN